MRELEVVVEGMSGGGVGISVVVFELLGTTYLIVSYKFNLLLPGAPDPELVRLRSAEVY